MNTEGFSNKAVKESSLPEVNTLTFEKLAPDYTRTVIITWLIFWLLAGCVSFIIKMIINHEFADLSVTYAIAPYLLIIASIFIWIPKAVKAKGFAIREKDLHYKSGIIWQETVSLPYNRIQHIELESGPLSRMYKLASLTFFTAGGDGADMKIPGLQLDRANKLKAFVLAQTETAQNHTHD